MALRLTPAPGGRRQAFRVALRMARRDISRHKGRSLLIILLIMIPVAGMTGAATLFQSMQETPAEQVQFQLGNTQARFRSMHAYNSGTVQSPVLDTSYGTTRHERDPDFHPANPKDVIPAGYQVLTESQVAVTAKSGDADVQIIGKAVDALNPAFAGKYTLLDGRAPAAPDEVVVSPGLVKRFSLQFGEELTTSAGTFTVVGRLRDATYSDNNSILFLKPGQGAVSAPSDRDPQDSRDSQADATMLYLVGAAPVTWPQILDLNKQGVAVLSRSVVLDPPPASELRDLPLPQRTPDWAAYLTGGLLGSLALLEVGLLAGAAFAVGAKRQVRELALLAASGAEAPTVRAVVTAAGLWLGTVAVVTGAVLGLGGAASVVLWVRLQRSVRLAGFHPDLLLTAAAMVMGLGACALAALVPARQVARQAALGALKSGRAPAVAGKWPARIGAGLLLLAVLMLAAGSWLGLVGDDLDELMSRVPVVAGLLIGGALLTVGALVLLTGGCVALMTSRTGWLPLPLRMAARDSARNRTRTVPAVAAVLAAATLATAAMVLTASQLEDAKRTHYWSALQHQGTLPLTETGPLQADGTIPPATSQDPAVLTSVLQQALGTVEWTQPLAAAAMNHCDMRAAADGSFVTGADPSNCLQYRLAVPAGNECPATPKGRIKDATDWRCNGSMLPEGISGQLPQLIVGGVAELRSVLGREPSREAVAVLDGGGMAVSNPVFVRDGRITLQAYDVRRPNFGSEGKWQGYQVISNVELPAAVDAPEVPVPFYGVISADTAAGLGLHFEPSVLLVQLAGVPSDAEQDELSAALAGIYEVPAMTLNVERGIDADNSALLWLIVGLSALITLSAAGITTGLALADARSDHMTLAAVGASPRLRKSLAGAQSLMTAGLGTLLGIIAGVVPAALIVAATRMFAEPSIPWLQLLALLVAVPLTGSALAWIFTRARLPVSRRSVGT